MLVTVNVYVVEFVEKKDDPFILKKIDKTLLLSNKSWYQWDEIKNLRSRIRKIDGLKTLVIIWKEIWKGRGWKRPEIIGG